MTLDKVLKLLIPNINNHEKIMAERLLKIEEARKESEEHTKKIEDTTAYFKKTRACLNGEDCWMTNNNCQKERG